MGWLPYLHPQTLDIAQVLVLAVVAPLSPHMVRTWRAAVATVLATINIVLQVLVSFCFFTTQTSQIT